MISFPLAKSCRLLNIKCWQACRDRGQKCRRAHRDCGQFGGEPTVTAVNLVAVTAGSVGTVKKVGEPAVTAVINAGKPAEPAGSPTG